MRAAELGGVAAALIVVASALPERGEAQQRAHVEVFGAFTVHLGAAEAFSLVEPEGERRWAAGWDPEYLWGASTARGTVFRTTGEHETLWQIVKHDPDTRELSYAYVTPGRRATLIDIRVVGLTSSEARVEVSYTMTALSQDEDAEVRSFEANYPAFLEHWAVAIQKHVVEGIPIGPRR